ncbi:MAG: ATP-binding protein [Kocuria sp.]|nr:ATP-binding protein [Kocuria sp.]
MPSPIRSTANSPFTPGYGKQPHIFAGHQAELEELINVFDTYDFGDNHSVLISGLRGSGKTSMLGRLQDEAAARQWLVIRDDASRGLMGRVMDTTIPALINTLEPQHRRVLSGLKVWHFEANMTVLPESRPGKPLLRDDLLALSHGTDFTGILITIDEVSSGRARMRELTRFALEVAHALQSGANIMVVFAGIKVDLNALQNQEHVTFLRRSKTLDFHRLSPAETAHALEETAKIGGRSVSADALTYMVKASQGYPYLVQLVGDYAWRNHPSTPQISLEDAQVASAKAVRAAQNRVISKVYDDLSDKDREFMSAMAVDTGASKVSDIVQRMGVKDQYVQVYKKRLIDSGYVRSVGHGRLEFSLPYLGEYIRAQAKDQELANQPYINDWEHYPPPVM